jgi:uncharacterized membrane protein
MKSQIASLLLLCAGCALPANAWAELRFCNRTGSNISVAIAWVQKDAPGTTTNQHRGVTLEGWWIFAPGECASVSDLHVGQHWVYYHAHSSQGTWAGRAMLCVPTRRFTTGGQFRSASDGCPTGTVSRGFHRIDSDARTFTMTLR